MNDRYLFRGKRVDNGEWVVGHYAQESNHTCFNPKTNHFIFKDVFLDWNLGGLEQYEIIPETVGQCTGLKDKDSKLIFEGDIIECYSYYEDIWGFSYTAECYGVIVWNTNNYCWNIKTNDELMPFNDYEWDISMVVGNIHDNPELLEVEKR